MCVLKRFIGRSVVQVYHDNIGFTDRPAVSIIMTNSVSLLVCVYAQFLDLK